NCASLDRLTQKKQRGRYWCALEDRTVAWKRLSCAFS
ncbi:unnamed protein product, partial [Brassica oleracea]